MNDLPTLPEIGATVSYLNGTITREAELHFTAIQPNGNPWRSHPNIKRATVAYAICVNRLRKCAGLPPERLPCAKCGERLRYGSEKNSYCPDCKQKAQGTKVKAKRSVRQTEQAVARAIARDYLAPSDGKRYADRTGIAPDYAAWVKDADALINRRLLALEQVS